MNKYAQQPQATYDFHGLRAWEVKEQLQKSLDGAREANYKLIHIIVGKGNNSSGDPVVRTIVQEFLLLWRYSYRFAKRNEGGEGVLVVHI